MNKFSTPGASMPPCKPSCARTWRLPGTTHRGQCDEILNMNLLPFMETCVWRFRNSRSHRQLNGDVSQGFHRRVIFSHPRDREGGQATLKPSSGRNRSQACLAERNYAYQCGDLASSHPCLPRSRSVQRPPGSSQLAG